MRLAFFGSKPRRSFEKKRACDGRIVGITPIGRATVRLLNMNTERRLEIREALRHLGRLE